MGDAKTGSRSTRAGTKRTTIRRRAVGTRERIISHLTAVDEISDPTGMASTRLAEAVGYPGSSVAFAQLLSSMERDGLIVREIRGKRTYRITLPEGFTAETGSPRGGYPSAPGSDVVNARMSGTGMDGTRLPGTVPPPGTGPTGFDYDELARRLLVQVVRRLAASSRPSAVAELATVDVPGALAESAPVERDSDVAGASDTASDGSASDGSAPDGSAPDGGERVALQQTVAGLERELATAWSRHGTLTAENARLREQLTQAQRALARERTRRAQIASELNQAEVVLLENLLTPAKEDGEKHSDATAR